MTNEQTIKKVAEGFKVMSDPTRLNILQILLKGESSVQEIANQLDVTVSAVSHQLKYLRTSRLIDDRREGKYVYYRIIDDHVKTILDMMFEHVLE